MRKRKLYGGCALILLLALAAAGMFPQIVLGIQDSYRTRNIQTKNRESLEVVNLDIPYEMSVGKRLANFAKNKDEFLVAGTDLEITAESYELMGTVLTEDMCMVILMCDILPQVPYTYDYVLNNGYGIAELKRYVIYDKELNNGVALMTRYYKLAFEKDKYLELLLDEKTYTVYYARYSDVELDSLFFSKVYTKDLVQYFLDYYECEQSQNEEVLGAVARKRLSTSIDMETGRMTARLPYGNDSLHLIFEKEELQNGNANVAVGIKQIAALIPEF